MYIYMIKMVVEKEFVPLNETEEDSANNVTWLQGTVLVSFNFAWDYWKTNGGVMGWTG
mgnify:CR=1 FL=1